MRSVTLLSRAGCHLCDEARAAVLAVAGRTGSPVSELDVDDDRELRAEYGDLVPVVLIDGVQHAYYRIDPVRLETALRR